MADVQLSEEALKFIPGVLKATSDEIYSDKSKEAAQVLLKSDQLFYKKLKF